MAFSKNKDYILVACILHKKMLKRFDLNLIVHFQQCADLKNSNNNGVILSACIRLILRFMNLIDK